MCHQGQGGTCGSSCSTARTLINLSKYGRLSSQPTSRRQAELTAKKGGREWVLYTDERRGTAGLGPYSGLSTTLRAPHSREHQNMQGNSRPPVSQTSGRAR